MCGQLLPAQPRPSALYLNMARWVCSCSSPLMTQEKSPKDSAPVGKGDKLGEAGLSPNALTRRTWGRLPGTLAQVPPQLPAAHSLEERERPLMKTFRNFLEKWTSGSSGVESSERQAGGRGRGASSYSSPMADS